MRKKRNTSNKRLKQCFFRLGLIDSRKCAGLETTVDNRLQQIIEQWEFLVQKSSDKSLKLKEASRQQTFNAGVKDVEFWLGEVKEKQESLFFISIRCF